MNQVRLFGDPFVDDDAATCLRAFLRTSLGSGLRCALSLTPVRSRVPAAGEREILLTDGVRSLRVGTNLPAAEVELLLRAAGEAAPATAPVLVFARAAGLEDALRYAGLEWPRAAAVLAARPGWTPAELLERVRAELRWAGSEHPPFALPERELAPWLALPAGEAGGAIVHVGSGPADGTDLAIGAWLQQFAASGHRLRLVVGDACDATVAGLRAMIEGPHAPACEILRSAFEPGHVRDAAVVVLPWRERRDARALVLALASGRPVCVPCWSGLAEVVGRPGVCHTIGGRLLPEPAGVPAHFEPDPRAVAAAIRHALGDAATGRHARWHVVEELTADRPAAPPAPVPDPRAALPSVVLEAPFFAAGAAAEVGIATARALLRRGRVDLRLVAAAPLCAGLEGLRARAPELLPLLCRTPGEVDLWLASGRQVRAARPACRTFALRVDSEYGALPLRLMPHVTQEADLVVVPGEHVRRTVTAAGRPMAGTAIVPHGVDEPMHERAEPDPRVTGWKGSLPAVLFCGGLVWRKGLDVFLRAVLAAHEAGARFCVVLKTLRPSRGGCFPLDELVERFQKTPGTPPLLCIDDELPRARLASLYTACDVLVHPYRGGSFCLPVLEARACGLPVLVTAGGAADGLLAGPGAQRIPAERRPLELPEAHAGEPWILEPSADATARLLAETLAALPARREQAVGFARAVRAAFPWDAVAVEFERLALAAMGKRRSPARAGPGEPVVTLPAVAPAAAPAMPAAAPVGARA
ncbi:MAG: glycosyltransferase [Planctomycetes bacterium]|nr:glycosyltransferase [Planctomycetota bacterium]